MQTDVQPCVVHQVRSWIKSITDKEARNFVKDLKTIYQADSEAQAKEALEKEETKCDKYPRQCAVGKKTLIG